MYCLLPIRNNFVSRLTIIIKYTFSILEIKNKNIIKCVYWHLSTRIINVEISII